MVAPLKGGHGVRPCATQPLGKHVLNRFPLPRGAVWRWEVLAVRPAWITGCKLPPRPLPGVVLFPWEEVHVVTQQDE